MNERIATTLYVTAKNATFSVQSRVEEARGSNFDEEQIRENEAIILRNRGRPSRDAVTKQVSLLRRIASTFPRLYFFLTQLVLPLLILIGMASLFGWGLATIESSGEIADNDAALNGVFGSYAAYVWDREYIHKTIEEVGQDCLLSYYENSTVTDEVIANQTEVLKFLFSCAESLAMERFPIDDLARYFLRYSAQLSFDWISCGRYVNETSNFTKVPQLVDKPLAHQQEYIHYVLAYRSDFLRLLNATKSTGNETNDVLLALESATGSQTCEVNVAGGALFWFTLMTTIGYGNAVPSTEGGRILVFTCGFLTIIGFLALNQTASNVLLTIVDDFLVRMKLNKLTTGFWAVLFWLCLFLLWMLIQSAIFIATGVFYDLSLRDAYWFFYITDTTVGLGDIYLYHEAFTARDMFSVPFLILFAFVILANFANKLISFLQDKFPADTTFEDILAASRNPAVKRALIPSSGKLIQRRHSL